MHGRMLRIRRLWICDTAGSSDLILSVSISEVLRAAVIRRQSVYRSFHEKGAKHENKDKDDAQSKE